MTRPSYIAICGAPESGKSTVAEHLARQHGGLVVDDGGCLRQACLALYGGFKDDFYTQAGKARTREVCGRSFSNRQLLGDLGNLLERYYGDQFMPERAIETARGFLAVGSFQRTPFFVFPSCRKNQGLTYLRHGGVVVEVVRPGYVPVNDFDHYDLALVTHKLLNNGSLDHLLRQVDSMLQHMDTADA